MDVNKKILENINELDIIKNQATINIGTLGHVSHGKSTLVEALTGIKPMKDSKELELSLTIKLGYCNFKVYKCQKCPKPKCYQYYGYSNKLDTTLPCKNCNKDSILIRHFSLVDNPGHNQLMSTMLSGASVIRGGIMVISGNDPVPQHQTEEHLVVADMLNMKDIIIVQSKLDLINKDKARKNCEKIKEFCHGTVAEGRPIVPTICIPTRKVNLDVLIEYLCEMIPDPIPKYNLELPVIMNIIRTFDINKPGIKVDDIKGGVIGGTIKQGILRVGMLVEIRPGFICTHSGKLEYKPLKTRVTSIFCEKNRLEYAVPGGLIGIGTEIDPMLTKSDKLQGHVLGDPKHIPDVYKNIKVKYQLMKYIVGSKEGIRVGKKDIYKVNIGTACMRAKPYVIDKKNNKMVLQLEYPICAEIGTQLAISKLYDNAWRLIGNGIMIE